MTVEWIATGKAARMLGYNRDHFRRKFIGLISHRVRPSGHIVWCLVEVLAVLDEMEPPTF